MSSRREIAALCGFAMVFSWLGYHVVLGERGLVALVKAQGEVAESRKVLATLSADRAALERRLAAMSPGQMDLDLAEERARAVLGYARRNEIVVNLAAPPAGPEVPPAP